jgi:xanthine dehydrogenase accessory factor
MKDVLADLDEWGDRTRVALATVVDVKRSAPRPPGAKMAINDRGQVSGAVSGGCVEGAVVEVAREVLEGGPPRVVRYGIEDDEAWDVGLPCGGEIAVWIQADPHPGFAAVARADGRAALVTEISTGERWLVTPDDVPDGLDAAVIGEAGDLMWLERSELREIGEREYFIDVTHPAPRLLAVGAVDFARQLCTVARAVGWRPYVIDPRGFFATATRFPDAEEVVTAWPQEGFARLGIDRATAIAVLTHDPKLDDAALIAALESDAGYIGAMGSRRAQATRRERLLAHGVPEEALDRIAAPIGLDLGALTAEETALSIMGEIVALRHGRAGGRLRDAGGRIHEVG